MRHTSFVVDTHEFGFLLKKYEEELQVVKLFNGG
jgi:hypothetical protein